MADTASALPTKPTLMTCSGMSSATAAACSAMAASSTATCPMVSRVSRTYTPVTTGSACAPTEAITVASLAEPPAPVGSPALKLSTLGSLSYSANTSAALSLGKGLIGLEPLIRHKSGGRR